MKLLHALYIVPLGILLVLTLGCSSQMEESDMVFLSAPGQRQSLFVAAYPQVLTGTEALERLGNAARAEQGAVRIPEHTADTIYRKLRFEEPLAPRGNTVLQISLNGPDTPLLVFTTDAEGRVTAVGGVPAAAAGSSTAQFQIPAPESPIAGIGLVIAADERAGDDLPELALVEPGQEISLGPEHVALPAGVQIRSLGGEIELTGLAQLHRPQQDVLQYLGFAYQHELQPVSGNRLPELETVPLDLVLTDGSTQRFTLRLRPGETPVYLLPGFVGGIPDTLRISAVPDTFRLKRVFSEAVSQDDRSPEPLPADLGVLYNYPVDAWRFDRFEIFRWNLFSNVLYFDFLTYGDQARMFRRLAFFVEKQGYQGTLLGNKDLIYRHGWNAHNYNGEGLSAFFNAVHEQDFQLSPQEEQLRRIVLDAGIITGEPGSYRPVRGGYFR